MKNNDFLEVLNYWKIIEFFKQSDYKPTGNEKKILEKIEKENKKIKEIEVKCNIESIENIKEKVSKYTKKFEGVLSSEEKIKFSYYGIRIGLIDRNYVIHKLTDILKLNDYEIKDIEKRESNINVFSFQIQSNMCIKSGSFKISPLFWFVYLLEAKDKSKLLNEDILDKYNEFNINLEKSIFYDDSEEPKQITQGLVDNLVSKLYTYLDIDYRKKHEEELTAIHLNFKLEKYKANLVDKMNENNNEDEELEIDTNLTMDFFSSDLAMVYNALVKNVSAYQKYSKEINYIKAICCNTKRFDLLKNEKDYNSRLSDIINFDSKPRAKWPSKYDPAFMQQVAINLITSKKFEKNREQQNNVFAVDGPPGTGKTTMLKEIIASNIVEKTILLSKYEDPDDAFKKIWSASDDQKQADQYWPSIYELKDDEINDYSMLVVSSNNTAVENITKELPLKDSVDLGDDSKYESINKELHGGLLKDKTSKVNNLFSDLLGEGYSDKIWAPISVSLGKKSNIKLFVNKFLSKFIRIYNSNEIVNKNKIEYKEIRDEFKKQYNKVQAMRKNILKDLLRINELLDKIKENDEIDIEYIEMQLKDLKDDEDRKYKQKLELSSYLDKFSLLKKVFQKKYYINQEKERNKLIKDLDEIEQNIKNLKEKKNKLFKNKEYKNELNELYEKYKDMVWLDCCFVEELLGENVENSTLRHTQNPYTIDNYNIELEKLFVLAVKLSLSFVMSSKCCRSNLRNLIRYWGLDDKGVKLNLANEEKNSICKVLYQNLFLLIPVISSSLASVGLMFSDINEHNAFGQVIIDEAGQAEPQAFLGSLYRHKKAIVVGDPKQIAPVVTSDLDLLKEICIRNNERLIPYVDKALSVQFFADQMNQYGTVIGEEWLGSPLIVHRRCISPMYDISNKISYDGLMKKPKSPENKQNFIIEKTCWDHVEGTEKGDGNHYVEEQAKKVLEYVVKGFENSDNPSLYIISPFTTVVKGIKEYIKNNYNEDISSWCKNNIGTIHKFQGKEANEVLFVLGCDTNQAKNFCVQGFVNANIVNVAVTRAKYRLAFIGDKEVWKNNRYIEKAIGIIENQQY